MSSGDLAEANFTIQVCTAHACLDCHPEEDASDDAARYQELSHTYKVADTGSRPAAACLQSTSWCL